MLKMSMVTMSRGINIRSAIRGRKAAVMLRAVLAMLASLLLLHSVQ